MAQNRESEIEARLQAITPGNWTARLWPGYPAAVKSDLICPDGHPCVVADDMSHDDARFLMNAPNDIRWLLHEVQRLRSAWSHQMDRPENS